MDRLFINEVPRNQREVIQIVVSARREKVLRQKWTELWERVLPSCQIFPTRNDTEEIINESKKMLIQAVDALVIRPQIPDVLKEVLTENQYNRYLKAKALGKGCLVKRKGAKVDL